MLNGTGATCSKLECSDYCFLKIWAMVLEANLWVVFLDVRSQDTQLPRLASGWLVPLAPLGPPGHPWVWTNYSGAGPKRAPKPPERCPIFLGGGPNGAPKKYEAPRTVPEYFFGRPEACPKSVWGVPGNCLGRAPNVPEK